ncbi:MAG: restriction endonuclease subunit S [Proteobacteria bacterium]|nr:restriction endonuclease subunit S [Pseudomonadota bacterium]MCG2742787.1 restriction endonuclease subunit S [Desulfobacteraceae bacterium]MBU4084136.1 restriction endonuclease subunit S [Pseudomonadota bacterium]MBU4106585.1 restriction endonuclease subunit S [Pseudomonadota bacterium]MBU4237221.1 restriction endonuclease subunit S [Pseudomonadota bacterium]
MKKGIKRVPKLRFPGFDETWDLIKLGNNSLKIGSGVTPKGGSKVYQNDGIVFIRSQNVHGDRLLLNNITFISQEIHEQMKSSEVHPSDILLNITGASIGRSCVVPADFTVGNVNQHVCIIRLKNGRSPNFYQSFLSSSKGQKLVYQRQAGGGREGLNFQSIRSFKIVVPTLPEQQKIASFLSAIDQKLQQLNRKKELLEQYKKGVLQKIFSREIRFQDENGQDYPDWQEKRLGTLAKKITTKNQNSTVTNVLTNSATQGIVSQQDYFLKDIANQNNLGGYYIVDTDDFVYNPRISSSAPVGPIKRNKLGKGVMSPLYSVLRFDAGSLNYFEYYFETTGWHTYMHSIANFGARHDRMNITNADFLKMPIPYPCKEERNMICLFLENLTTKLDVVKAQLAQTRTFKKGLLQQLFV